MDERHLRSPAPRRERLRPRRVLLLLIASLLAVTLMGASFDVSITHWDGKRYQVELAGGDAVLGWPGREIVVTPRPGADRGITIRPLFAARRRGRGWAMTPRSGDTELRFRITDARQGASHETHLRLLLPVPVRTDSAGVVLSPPALRGYPLGLYPAAPPARHRTRARALSRRFYVITEADSPRRIAPNFTLGMFCSKIRPRHHWSGRAHPLTLDYGIVDLISRINAAWNRAGYAGRVRIESPFRTPDYNDADAAGRATFSLHMYGSACDIILSTEDDKLHDDVNRDGRRDLDDLLPLARIVKRMMRDGELAAGGIGVYHYIYRDGRPEEFMMHVDLRGRLGTWGELYDSDTVRPAGRIAW